MFKKAFQFESSIWKVLPLDSSHLVVELRDSTTRTVVWKKMNIQSGSEVWSYSSSLDNWWVTLKYIHPNYIALTAFSDSEMPESKGIEILDSKSCRLVWKNNALNTVYIDPQYIIASDESGDNYWNYDWATGNVKEELPLKKVFSIRNNSKGESIITHPYIFSTENEFYSKISTYITQTAGHTTTGDIEYLEVDHKVVISYYICVENGMNQYLLISTSEGQMAVQECLGENLKGFGGETFFVMEKNVFALKSLNTVLHYQI